MSQTNYEGGICNFESGQTYQAVSNTSLKIRITLVFRYVQITHKSVIYRFTEVSNPNDFLDFTIEEVREIFALPIEAPPDKYRDTASK